MVRCFSLGGRVLFVKGTDSRFFTYILFNEKFLVTCLVAYIHSVDPIKVQTAIKKALWDMYGSYSKFLICKAA